MKGGRPPAHGSQERIRGYGDFLFLRFPSSGGMGPPYNTHASPHGPCVAI